MSETRRPLPPAAARILPKKKKRVFKEKNLLGPSIQVAKIFFLFLGSAKLTQISASSEKTCDSLFTLDWGAQNKTIFVHTAKTTIAILELRLVIRTKMAIMTGRATPDIQWGTDRWLLPICLLRSLQWAQ
jgi:hypothetical protein